MKHQLDFEKPITELQNKLNELRDHPEKHSLGISFEEEIQIIEQKIEETRRQIFLNLTPWQRVQLARHPRAGHRHAKRPRHQGKYFAQFRVRPSGRLSQSAALDAAGK